MAMNSVEHVSGLLTNLVISNDLAEQVKLAQARNWELWLSLNPQLTIYWMLLE